MGNGGGIAGLVGDTIRSVDAISQRRNMAEMAAQSFDQIGGDQAQYWAKSLRANPRAAWAMAKEHGGVGAIEQGLMAAKAQAEAQRTRQAATPDQLVDYFARQEGDPSKAKALAETYKVQQESMAQGFLSGASPEEILNYYQRTDPAKAKAFRESMESLNPEDRRAKLAERKPAATVAKSFIDSYNSLSVMTDFNNPEWEFPMAVVLNKVLQPNSAVLLGEAEAVSRDLAGFVQRTFRRNAQGAFEPKGELNSAERRKLWTMAMDLTKAGLGSFKKQQNAWKSQNGRFQLNEVQDLFTRPGEEYLPWIDEILGSSGGMSPEAAISAARDGKAGSRVTVNGKTYEKTERGTMREVDE